MVKIAKSPVRRLIISIFQLIASIGVFALIFTLFSRGVNIGMWVFLLFPAFLCAIFGILAIRRWVIRYYAF